MKRFFSALLLIYFTTASSQYAHINDPDGQSNVRGRPEKGDNILHTLPNKTLVYSVPTAPEGEWAFIEFTLDGREASGWIHESRLNYVGNHQKIPLIRYTDKESELAGSNIRIVFIQRNFDPNGKKIGYSSDGTWIETIDERKIWGTDGNMPHREYESISIWFGNEQFTLPKEALQGLYEPNLNYVSASYDTASDTLYIESLNSDAAGAYEVMWIIEKGKYRDRHISIPF